MPLTHGNAVTERLSRYVDKLFEHLADRLAPHIAERLEATLDVLTDPGALDDLRLAAEESDDEARPYEEIRRELGLA